MSAKDKAFYNVRDSGRRAAGGGRANASNENANNENANNENANNENTLIPALIVISVFMLALCVLIILSDNGVDVPLFTAAYFEMTGNGGADGDGGGAGGGGKAGGENGAGGKSGADGGVAGGNDGAGGVAGSVAGGAGGIASGASGANNAAGESGAEGAARSLLADGAGGVPPELKGSGGAWDGAEIRMPALSLPYDASEETEFCLYMGYLAECSRDGFSLYDKSGAEAFRKNVEFVKPALFVRGDYLLACDFGGRSAFVMKGPKLVWEDAFAYEIVNASINKNGYIALVTDAAGYRNSIKVIAPFGQTLYDWVIADDYAIGSEVAPSGGGLVINRLKTSGIKLRSRLEFLDMKSEPVLTIDSGEEEVFLSARYLDNDALAVASGDKFTLYSEARAPVLSRKYASVSAICEFPKKRAAVAAWDGGRASVVEIDSETLKERVLFYADRPVRGMSAGGGCLFINLGDEAVVLKENGKAASNLVTDSETLYGGASEAFGALVVNKKCADVYAY